ncbi:MAG: hypothetical protein SR2Q5_04820 [Quinella sp. 2Q5]|nr:hypothetical protein [Quinella sp. 2Q5]
MFKAMKTTALAMCSAIIIGLSSGTAQASVAEENLIGQTIMELDTVESGVLRDILRKKAQEDRRRDWERHRYERERYRDRDSDRYGPPPKPPGYDRDRYDRDRDRERYGPPPKPPGYDRDRYERERNRNRNFELDRDRDANGYGQPPRPPR